MKIFEIERGRPFFLRPAVKRFLVMYFDLFPKSCAKICGTIEWHVKYPFCIRLDKGRRNCTSCNKEKVNLFVHNSLLNGPY